MGDDSEDAERKWGDGGSFESLGTLRRTVKRWRDPVCAIDGFRPHVPYPVRGSCHRPAFRDGRGAGFSRLWSVQADSREGRRRSNGIWPGGPQSDGTKTVYPDGESPDDGGVNATAFDSGGRRESRRGKSSGAGDCCRREDRGRQ